MYSMETVGVLHKLLINSSFLVNTDGTPQYLQLTLRQCNI